MRHASGKLSDCIHLLGLCQLLFETRLVGQIANGVDEHAGSERRRSLYGAPESGSGRRKSCNRFQRRTRAVRAAVSRLRSPAAQSARGVTRSCFDGEARQRARGGVCVEDASRIVGYEQRIAHVVEDSAQAILALLAAGLGAPSMRSLPRPAERGRADDRAAPA